MSIEDDVALLERVPTLRLLGTTALRMLAIGSEQRDVARGARLFSAGDDADAVRTTQGQHVLRTHAPSLSDPPPAGARRPPPDIWRDSDQASTPNPWFRRHHWRWCHNDR